MRCTPRRRRWRTRTPCTASSTTVSGDGATTSATASTTVVSAAANRAPRGSIWRARRTVLRCDGLVLDMGSPAEWLTAAGRHGHVDAHAPGQLQPSSTTRGGVATVPSGHSTQRRAHAAVVHCAALGEHGRGHTSEYAAASRPGIGRLTMSDTTSSMWTAFRSPTTRPRVASTASRVGAPAGPGDLAAPGVEDQRGRRAEDPEPAHQVEVLLGVDLDVPHAGHQPATSPRTRGWLGRARRTPRRTAAAWPAPELVAEVVRAAPARPRGSRSVG